MKKIVFLFALLLAGCSSKMPDTSMTLTRDSFMHSAILDNPERIVLNDVLDPANMKVMCDSLLVINNQPSNEYLVEIYSLNNMLPIVKMVTRGSGPKDMLSCAVDISSNVTNDFLLQDAERKEMLLVNLDTLLNQGELNYKDRFRYSPEVLQNGSILPLDNNRYVADNMWYVDNPKYSNGVEHRLSIFQKNSDSGLGISNFKYFTAQVIGDGIFFNHSDGNIWAIDQHRDYIRIYDDTLGLVRTIQGPDFIEPVYELKNTNAPIRFVSFSGDRTYEAYSDFFVTKSHIYIVYNGLSINEKDGLSHSEVFVFGLDGIPVSRFQMDRYIYSISVDTAEEYLYCLSPDSFSESTTLFKYKM
mgnify:CR=1 FL=1